MFYLLYVDNYIVSVFHRSWFDRLSTNAISHQAAPSMVGIKYRSV